MKSFKEFLKERLSSVKPSVISIGTEMEGGVVAGETEWNEYIIVAPKKYEIMGDFHTAQTYCKSIEIDNTKGWKLGDISEMGVVIDNNKKLPKEYQLEIDWYVTSDNDRDMDGDEYYTAIYCDDGEQDGRFLGDKELCRPIKLIKKG